jgi:ribose transport system permease protein
MSFDTRYLRSRLSEPWAGVAVFLIVVSAVMSFASPVFLTWTNWLNMLNQSSFAIILAIAMTVVLMGGGIDLSVGALAGLSAGVAAWLIATAELPLALALLLALALGTALGLVNAWIILRLRIPDFIATLAMMGFASGILYVWTAGVPFIGYTDSTYLLIGGLHRLAGSVTVPQVVTVVVAALCLALVKVTRFGRHLRATGENPDVARLSGVNVVRVKFAIYGVSGFLARLVGILLAGRLTTVQPNLGLGLEVNALAAAIMGGAALSGGRGSIVGAILGALTLTVIQNVINLLGVQPAWEKLCIGLIILAVTFIGRTSGRVGAACAGSVA